MTTDYTYDGDGTQISRTTGSAVTTFVYDAAGNLAAEYGPAAAPACQVSSPFVRATCFLTTDHLGSVRMVTDAAGTVISRHDYLPFGEEIPASVGNRSAVAGYGAGDGVPERFTGKERDGETGLDYFGARYYSGAQGRFMSPDEFKGGIVDSFTGHDIETNTALPYADITDPQTLNKYAYVRNNPVRYTDPDGHCVEALTCAVEFAGAGTVIGGPVGTVVGAVIGAGVGAFLGYEIGKAIVESLPGTPISPPGATGIPATPTATDLTTGTPGGPASTDVNAHTPGTSAETVAGPAPIQSSRSANDVKPDPNATAAHSVPKRDANGKVVGYTTYNDKGGAVKRVDTQGASHGGVPTPHVQEAKPGKGPGAPLRHVRPARPDELPK